MTFKLQIDLFAIYLERWTMHFCTDVENEKCVPSSARTIKHEYMHCKRSKNKPRIQFDAAEWLCW